MRKGKLLFDFLFAIVFFVPAVGAAEESIAGSSYSLQHPITSPHYPVLITGAQVSSLLGAPVGSLSVFTVKEGQLTPIAFQIDRKDRRGNFQIASTSEEKEKEWLARLDENDEIVFMASDIGSQLTVRPRNLAFDPSAEIKIEDPKGSVVGWVYFFQGPGKEPIDDALDHVHYDAEQDAVETENYRIQFSSNLPFLPDSLQWRVAGQGAFGPNIVRAMTIEHTGKFLHKIKFRRTDEDYTSELVAVKDGPVRVIRRTANRVHIIFGIGSPKVYIDYLIYPSGFVMDTIVDFPFKIGLLFSDLDATTVLLLKDLQSLRPVTAYSQSQPLGVVTGQGESSSVARFNALQDTAILLGGPFGQLVVDVALEPHSPIEASVLLVDEVFDDTRSTVRGGRGTGAGFYMTKWEKLDTQTHHILFRAYLLKEHSPREALRLLRDSPFKIQ